jgi:SRSO17 transposase
VLSAWLLELSTARRILVGVTDDVVVADVEAWASGLDELAGRIAWRFARSEPRLRVAAYLRGLLAPLERKNGWTLAEAAGESNPDGMQRLLSTADWDSAQVREDLRDYVVEHLGDPGAVLVVDETGFLKKGSKSAGVARQYSGTAARIENCQIGVLLGYATAGAHTFLDAELYLPRAWTDDRDRCREARVGEEVVFATKPELAIAMLARAIESGVPARWLTGDEVYGQHPGLRRFCDEQGLSYVLAVPSNQWVWTVGDGPIPRQHRVGAVAARLPAQAFKRISPGAGTKGPRIYHWARTELHPRPDAERRSWLLVRRRLSDPTDLAYYLCQAPATTTLAELARIAGTRWTIEENFQTGKGEVGLDHYQVRRYDGWYRPIPLAMFAHAFLAVTRATVGKKGISIPN